MKAAVMTEFRQPLKIMDLPDPSPGPDSALIRVEACGICRSDWHLWQGDWAWMGIQPALPLVMGHELAGVVESVGADVHTFRPGDRVTLTAVIKSRPAGPRSFPASARPAEWSADSHICPRARD